MCWFITTQICYLSLWVRLLIQVLTSYNEGINRSAFVLRPWGEFICRIIQIVGRAQFFVVVGLRSPSRCWLSAEDHSNF